MPDHEEKPLRQVIKELAESSSMHGIPKVVSSRQLSVKFLWCVLVIGTFSVMSYQLYVLFENFNSNPIVTRVNLDFSSLRYPSVTFCNMNPVKKSMLGMVPSLKDIIYKKKTKPKADDTQQYESQRSKRNAANETKDESLQNEEFDDIHVHHDEDLKDTDILSSTDSYNVSHMNDSHDGYDYSGYYGYGDYSGHVESDYNEYVEDADLDDEAKEIIKSPRNRWKKQRDEIKTAIKKSKIKLIREIGHQKEDIIFSYSFAGRRQNISEITQFTSPHYGNCFEISSPNHKAWRSGPDHGIKLTLNLETEEYIPSFASGFGMRIVFNQPGALAMPNEEGLTISSGFDTSIGLRAVRISRLGEPYGKCNDGKQFMKDYGISYTVAACMEFCRVTLVMISCDCIPYDAPELFTKENNGLDVCGAMPSKDAVCALTVEYSMEDGQEACDCPSACEYTNSFLTVRVYFEDLNYERIEEEPMYELERFVSDIGGALGLFAGVSVLTVVELFQLVMEICLYVFRRSNPKTNVHDNKHAKADDRQMLPMI